MQNYKPIFHSLSQALVVFEKDLTILDATDKFLKIAKIDRKKLKTMTFEELFKSQELQSLNITTRKMKNGSTECMVHEYHKNDLMDAQHSADILDRIHEGFFTLDPNLVVTNINPVTRIFVGKRKSQVIGKKIYEIFPAGGSGGITERFVSVIKTKVAESFEADYDGHTFHIQIYPKKGAGVAVFWRDITDQKKVHDELKTALSMRNEFISIASHELKTPLTALLLQMEMAKRQKTLSPEKVSKIIEHTHKDVLRLKRLVDDMLDISRIASGKLTMDLDYFHLDEFIEELVGRMDPAFPDYAKIKLELGAPVIVRWDRFRIEQVVMNLLTNASRYGRGNDIILKTKMGGNLASIVVQDFGIGIPEDNLRIIFERFERGQASRETSGLGLGLYICQEIVANHKGVIKVESCPGEGSTFTAEIPFN